MLKPDSFQELISKEYKKGENILINAGAGSGKTSTLKMLVNKTSPNKKIILNSFNKHIVEELRIKIKHPNLLISTTHSLAYNCIKQIYGHVPINENKYVDFLFKRGKKLREIFDIKDDSSFYKKIYFLNECVNFYYLYFCANHLDLIHNMSKNNVSVSENEAKFVEKLVNYFYKQNETPSDITFAEMVYLPTIYDIYQMPHCHVLMVDECQDTSTLQQEFYKKIISENEDCQTVFVGDEKQAIYGFNGADSNAFGNIKTIHKMKEMDLSFCYRCGDAIIDHANKVHNKLIKPKNVKSGTVRNGGIEDIKSNDMVICRNNAPLVEVFFELLKKDVPAFVRGKDLEKGLLSMVKKHSKKSKSIDNFLNNLHKFVNSEMEDLIKKGKNPKFNEKFSKLCDKVEIIKIMSSKSKTISDINALIRSMCVEKSNSCVLSSIHGSKGLEAGRVFILREGLIPSKYAITGEQKKQETNLKYVARTRAIKELIFIN